MKLIHWVALIEGFVTLVVSLYAIYGEIDVLWAIILLIIWFLLFLISLFLLIKQEKMGDHPSLEYNISIAEWTPQGNIPIGTYGLYIKNSNPNVGAKECSMTHSYDGEELVTIKPAYIIPSKYHSLHKTFEIPPKEEIALSCIDWFYQFGTYRLFLRYKSEVTSHNRDSKGAKYWHIDEVEILCSGVEEKHQWEIIGKPKTKRDGKINGNS